MKRYEALFVLCLVGLCSGLFGACRSTKEATEETTMQAVSAYSADSAFNAAVTAEKTAENRTDSSDVRADERGRVEIERDSAGRPTLIVWNLDWHIRGKNTLQTETGRRLYGLNASRHSEASGKTDTDTKKTKETKTEVDTSMPLETLVGAAIFGFAVLYIIYVIIVDHVCPWIKQRRQ